MVRDFYSPGGLNIQTYDTRGDTAVVEADVAFYAEIARESPGPVLELGCGTGRVSIPLARAGLDVVGLDLSQAMLDISSTKLQHEPAGVQSRLHLVHGDMAAFDLDHRFGLVIIPFRAFQLLLTPEAERSCLAAIHRHLDPGGRLVIDIFDPLLNRLIPGGQPQEARDKSPLVPSSREGIEVTVVKRLNHTLDQVIEEVWRFTQSDSSGEVVREEEEVLRLRWLYRYEMRYLLQLSGFEIEAEYSDYHRSPPAYGKEQVWVARKS